MAMEEEKGGLVVVVMMMFMLMLLMDMICNNKDWWLCRSLGTLGEKEKIEENRRGPKWFSSLLPILVVSIESGDCPSTGQNYSM